MKKAILIIAAVVTVGISVAVYLMMMGDDEEGVSPTE